MQQSCPMCGFISDSPCIVPDGHPQSSILSGIALILREELSDSTIQRAIELLRVEQQFQSHQSSLATLEKRRMQLLQGTSSNGRGSPLALSNVRSIDQPKERAWPA